jgi:thiol-disulfide isomerase/thioredoxin
MDLHMIRKSRVLLLLLIGALAGVPSFAAQPPPLKAGDAAPDLLGKDEQRNAVRLIQYRGKVVVVSFFASWCEPCRKELPMLESLQRAGADKGLQVIAVDWNEDRRVFRDIMKIAKSYQLKFVSDENGWAASSYGVRAIPHMVLIGRDGKISYVQLGYGESVIDKLLPKVNEALLASAAPASPTS